MNKQRGVIPPLVLVVILLSTLLGGIVGYSLGDGSLFGLGVGFAIAFFIILSFWPKIRDLLKKIKKEND